MTRDEIIRMMIEACDIDKVGAWSNGFWTITQKELERFAALVAAAEREACAKLAENTVCDMHLPTGIKIYGYKAANAIRARGNNAS